MGCGSVRVGTVERFAVRGVDSAAFDFVRGVRGNGLRIGNRSPVRRSEDFLRALYRVNRVGRSVCAFPGKIRTDDPALVAGAQRLSASRSDDFRTNPGNPAGPDGGKD